MLTHSLLLPHWSHKYTQVLQSCKPIILCHVFLYHPTLLPKLFFSKHSQKHIKNIVRDFSLSSFFMCRLFLNPLPSGFYPPYSTETVLSKIIQDHIPIAKCIEHFNLILLELCAAFDTGELFLFP